MERIKQETLDQILKSKNRGEKIACCFQAMTSYCVETTHAEGEEKKFYMVVHLLTSIICRGLSIKVTDFLIKFENQVPREAGKLLCEKLAKMEGVNVAKFLSN